MKFGTPGCAGGSCAPRAYVLQSVNDGWRDGFDLVRASDGETICNDYGEPEDKTLYRDFAPMVDELNRLAEENAKLREGRDEKLHAQEKQLEQLRIQLSTKTAEINGQEMLWPSMQY